MASLVTRWRVRSQTATKARSLLEENIARWQQGDSRNSSSAARPPVPPSFRRRSRSIPNVSYHMQKLRMQQAGMQQ